MDRRSPIRRTDVRTRPEQCRASFCVICFRGCRARWRRTVRDFTRLRLNASPRFPALLATRHQVFARDFGRAMPTGGAVARVIRRTEGPHNVIRDAQVVQAFRDPVGSTSAAGLLILYPPRSSPFSRACSTWFANGSLFTPRRFRKTFSRPEPVRSTTTRPGTVTGSGSRAIFSMLVQSP